MISRFRRFVVILCVPVLLLASCSRSGSSADNTAAAKAAARPVIVFMTDFGAANDAVAICKAVMLGIAPDARTR